MDKNELIKALSLSMDTVLASPGIPQWMQANLKSLQTNLDLIVTEPTESKPTSFVYLH